MKRINRKPYGFKPKIELFEQVLFVDLSRFYATAKDTYEIKDYLRKNLNFRLRNIIKSSLDIELKK